MTIKTNYRWREIEYKKPEWSDDEESCFTYRGDTYFLSEFMMLGDGELRSKGYDAAMPTSAFSGIAVKLSDDAESVQVAYVFE